MTQLEEIPELLREHHERTGRVLYVRLFSKGGGNLIASDDDFVCSWESPVDAMRVIRHVAAAPPTKEEAMDAYRQISLAFSKFSVVDSQSTACSIIRHYIEAQEAKE